MLADSPSVVSSSIVNEQDQPTLVARGQQNAPVPALSQAEVIASSSDNLFNPVTHDPSSYVFKLQNVPSQPRPRRINAIPHNQDFGAFISLTETVLELDVIFKPTAQSTARAPRQLPAPPTTSSLSTATATAPDPSNIPKKEQNCSNCKSRGLRYVGHTDATCFHPGGGMEGRREEYFSN